MECTPYGASCALYGVYGYPLGSTRIDLGLEMKSLSLQFRSMKTLLVLAGAATLAGCSSIGYRCPLDATEKPEYPTACSSMQEAMSGAKRGTGGKTSVLMDDKGRLIPPELLKAQGKAPVFAGNEPYRQKSGDPVFIQPKKFQAWTRATVDANGNLHDGHHAWFTTPGRWAYGTVDKPGVVGANTLSPSRPEPAPGRVVSDAEAQARAAQERTPQPNAGNVRAAPAGNSTQEREQAALQNLSAAANSFSNPRNPQPKPAQAKQAAAPGVTAPELGLLD